MKRLMRLTLFSLVALLACNNEPEKQKNNSDVFVDTMYYFDYASKMSNELDSIFLRKDIALFSYTSDSSRERILPIDSIQIRNFAQEFISKDITKMPLKQFYKENIFTDLTINTTVINYTTQKDSLPVKKVDVLLNAANGEEVKRIDMKLLYAKNDSTISENYAWVFGKSFYKNRYAEANGKGVASTLKLSWIKKSK